MTVAVNSNNKQDGNKIQDYTVQKEYHNKIPLSQRAKPISKAIYLLTLTLPQIHQFSIGEQLRRSSLSISLNITEAGARKNIGEKKQLLNVAFGSLKETVFLLEFLHEVTPNKEIEPLLAQLDNLARVLYVIIYRR